MNSDSCFPTNFTIVENPFVVNDNDALFCSEDSSGINKKYMEHNNNVYILQQHNSVSKKGEIHIKGNKYRAVKTIVSMFDKTDNSINNITVDAVYCSDNILTKSRVILLMSHISSPIFNNQTIGCDGFKVKVKINDSFNVGNISQSTNIKVINSNGLIAIIDKMPVRNSQDCVIYFNVVGNRTDTADNCINNNIYIDTDKLSASISEKLRTEKNTYVPTCKYTLTKMDHTITLTITDHNLDVLHNTSPTTLFTLTPECLITLKLNLSDNIKKINTVSEADKITVMITSGEINVYDLNDVEQIVKNKLLGKYIEVNDTFKSFSGSNKLELTITSVNEYKVIAGTTIFGSDTKITIAHNYKLNK